MTKVLKVNSKKEAWTLFELKCQVKYNRKPPQIAKVSFTLNYGIGYIVGYITGFIAGLRDRILKRPRRFDN